MSHSLRVLVADSTDPYFNLAVEDWIFNDMESDQKVLFLWRNEKSIIVGRGQNVWSECDLDQVESDGVHLVRRHSGGGAVYQDLGNTCFTFMCAKENGHSTKELYARNNQILLSCLASLSIQAEASGRNDLVIRQDEDLFKISGSAFKESRDRCFHHGTMLFAVDLNRLARYLTPDSTKLKAKGIKSVKSRVMNLSQLDPSLDHEIFCQALIQSFFRYYNAKCEIEHLDTQELKALPQVERYYEQLKSWDWVYGKTPSFQSVRKQRFDWGGVEFHLDSEKGRIQETTVFTDSLYPELLEEAPTFLEGKDYSSRGVGQAKKEHLQATNDPDGVLDEFYDWIGSGL